LVFYFKKLKYKLKNLTPKDMQCAIGACYSIYETNQNSYLIIGTSMSPQDFGLEKKVAEHETLIEVPKKLIDEMGK